jgi:hypothetical protein
VAPVNKTVPPMRLFLWKREKRLNNFPRRSLAGV